MRRGKFRCSRHGVSRRSKPPIYMYKKRRRTNKTDLVEVMLNIMEDRPKPKLNYRPAKKRPTAADQFNSSHGDRVEAQPAGEAARLVDAHNSGYPKLRDELDRRRSLAQVSAVQIHNGIHLNCDPNQLRCFTKRSGLVNCKSHKKIVKTPKVNSSSKSCQYLYDGKYRNSENDSLSKMVGVDRGEPSKSSEDSISKLEPRSPSKRPSVASMSSYNSFDSMGHEPMV